LKPVLDPWDTRGTIHTRSPQSKDSTATLAVWKRGNVYRALYFPLECGHGDDLEWDSFELHLPGRFGWADPESARAALDKFFEEEWPTGLGTLCPSCLEKHHRGKLLAAAEIALAAGLLSEDFAESIAHFQVKWGGA
jgi:hypothetical protein